MEARWKRDGKKGPEPPLKEDKKIFKVSLLGGYIDYRYKHEMLQYQPSNIKSEQVKAKFGLTPDQVKSEYAFNLVEKLPPPLAAFTELNSKNAIPIIWGSRASVYITFDKDDFTDFSNECELTTLKGSCRVRVKALREQGQSAGTLWTNMDIQDRYKFALTMSKPAESVSSS